MAPAGNFECLHAAIQGGADSVYFGVGHLNMRSNSANNFKPSDLSDVVNGVGNDVQVGGTADCERGVLAHGLADEDVVLPHDGSKLPGQ